MTLPRWFIAFHLWYPIIGITVLLFLSAKDRKQACHLAAVMLYVVLTLHYVQEPEKPATMAALTVQPEKQMFYTVETPASWYARSINQLRVDLGNLELITGFDLDTFERKELSLRERAEKLGEEFPQTWKDFYHASFTDYESFSEYLETLHDENLSQHQKAASVAAH